MMSRNSSRAKGEKLFSGEKSGYLNKQKRETRPSSALCGSLLEAGQDGVKEGILDQVQEHLPGVCFGVT